MPLKRSDYPNSWGVPGTATTPNARDGVWIPVLSSYLHRIQYVGEDKRHKRPLPARLWIQFWTKVRGGNRIPGPIFVYTGVPREVWDGLLAASSKGKYFHAQIKDRFPFSPV